MIGFRARDYCSIAIWLTKLLREQMGLRPVGYDNGFIYLKYMAYGPEKLKKLKKAGVV
jgi:hypothetical protein